MLMGLGLMDSCAHYPLCMFSRWKTIAEFIGGGRTEAEVIAKAKEIQKKAKAEQDIGDHAFDQYRKKIHTKEERTKQKHLTKGDAMTQFEEPHSKPDVRR